MICLAFRQACMFLLQLHSQRVCFGLCMGCHHPQKDEASLARQRVPVMEIWLHLCAAHRASTHTYVVVTPSQRPGHSHTFSQPESEA